MFKKFLALFTWRKSSDSGVTPNAPAPWPNPAGTNRRIQPERIAPFGTGTPHDRMHGLIAAGKPDALIAIELGVDISAVRNYRHIISARGREAARRAAGARLPPRVLDTAWMNREQSDHREWQRRKAAERVPAALLRRAEKPDETARINETFGKFYAQDVSQSVIAEGCARVAEAVIKQKLIKITGQKLSKPCGGGDFGGAGSTGSFNND